MNHLSTTRSSSPSSPRGSRLRMMLAAAVATLAMVGMVSGARADQNATEVVKSLVNPALQILGDTATPLPDRQQKLRSLVSGNIFDFTAMARSALGLHWRDINAQQQQDFTQVFTAFLRDSYISRIADYSGQQVKVNFLGETDIGNGATEVKTTIEQSGGKAPIQVNYALRGVNGKSLIYDITIDNISIAANYRNQFNRVINNQGFDALMTDLKNKQQGLEASLGTAHGQ
jgi:phospholipid transport system substrate-binding protein